ncbi:MAG: hypothetical protein RBU37_15530 [Myxococcota bacterium]|jgi:hypothetical protein|nr:hypothetical protein [Myxococcota bacterium]
MKARVLLNLAALLLFLGSVVACGDNSGKVIRPDVSDQSETDVSDLEVDTDVPDVDPCNCGAGEVCVNNGVVTNACFPLHCPDEVCGEGEVCAGGECVVLSCAGLYCGEYPNICRDGVCTVGKCSDPDVGCPGGKVCVNDECLTPCQEDDACLPLACLGGFCRPCEVSSECPESYLCVSRSCRPSCQLNPAQCGPDEYCDSASLACLPKCTSDDVCSREEICDFDTGLCVPAECTSEGSNLGCEPSEVCLNGRCVPANPPFFGNFCAGAAVSTNGQHSAATVLAPVELVGAPMSSAGYRLTSGSSFVLVTQ